MSNVVIEKSKIDNLANAIAVKSGESAPMTLTEMVQAVDGIETDPSGSPTLETVTKTYTPSTTAVTDTITPSSGYDGIEEVDVTIEAIPSGTAGTPTATKGTVSNHSISVTPSVTNTSGYIDGGTKTGTAVTVAASELVSGTYNAYSHGTFDITNYESLSVPVVGATTTTWSEAYATVNNKRQWRNYVQLANNTAGWKPQGSNYYYSEYRNAVPANTTITPSTSAQTVGGADYMMEGAVTVAAMPTGTEGTPTATKGTVSNHSVSVTPSVTNSSGYITGGTKTGTAVTVSASELASGSQTITENGTVNVVGLEEVVVNVSGGSTGMTVATATKTLSTAASSIQFTNLSGQPTSFAVTSSADLSTGGTKAVAVVYDGTSLHGMDLTTQAEADTGYTQSYSNGTLTITATSASFQANAYKLVYTYGGTSANLGTEDVQVGSGATSITFTGLTAEPDYFSCIFKSSFSTSSGYQRVMGVVYDGNSIYGNALDSSAHALTSWTYSYSNGSLTITSTGTNNGGYFHQPGNYQLTYGIGGTVEPTQIEVEPLSVTTNGTYTAPTGKAYSPVTVNVSGGGGVNVDTVTWSNSSTSTVSHTFSSLKGTPKAAFLRCTAQLTRSSSNTYYYIADICWDGTNAYGNYHLRSNGSYNNVATDAASGFNVTTGTNSITFSSDASSRSSAPGSFYNGAYELTYVY